MQGGAESVTRREFLDGAVIGAGLGIAQSVTKAQERVSLVTITLDCEMSMHYPTRGQMEWNYKKGDLDDASKEYAVVAARRVTAAGGKMHFFIVGRVFEHASV